MAIKRKRGPRVALPPSLCKCGGLQCNVDPNRLYTPKQQYNHRRNLSEPPRAKEHLLSVCNCAWPECQTGKLYSQRTRRKHAQRLKQAQVDDDDASFGYADADEPATDPEHDLASEAEGKVDPVEVHCDLFAQRRPADELAAFRSACIEGPVPQDSETDSSLSDEGSGAEAVHFQEDEPGVYPQMEQEPDADPVNLDEENYDHLNFAGDFEHPLADDPQTVSEDEADDASDDDGSIWNASLGTGLSVMLLVTMLFSFQDRYKVNNTAMTALFRIFKFVFQAVGLSVKLPSFDRCRTKFAPPEGCKVQARDVCPDCEWLYDTDGSQQCPICQADRYKEVKGKQVPRKKFFRWSLIEQLKMRLQWKGFAAKLEAVPAVAHDNHAPNVVSSNAIPPELRSHIQIATQLGAYMFILGIACDGFNPWRGVQYTMWFLACRILNMKLAHAAKTDDVITVGITCGPREPKTLQYYAAGIVEELILLRANDISVPRSMDNGSVVDVPLQAHLVAVIGDYPALCKMLNAQGVSAKLACVQCWVVGLRLLGLRQYCYPTHEAGNEFLPITPEEMQQYAQEAQLSGQPVNGIKGRCPLHLVMPNMLPSAAVIDLAHTLV
jgi:hypothetical protein